MNVGQLRKAIAHLPDDMPVAIQSECGWSDLNLYVCDANVYRSPNHPSLSPYVSDGHVNTGHEVYKDHTNTTALLFSEWGNDGEDITPRTPSVIEGEIAPAQIPVGKLPFGTCGCGSTSCAVLTEDHKCWCLRCNPGTWWMVTCGQCGDKRCPKAVSHTTPCMNLEGAP